MKYLYGATALLLVLALVDNPEVVHIAGETGIQLGGVRDAIQSVFDSIQSMGFFS